MILGMQCEHTPNEKAPKRVRYIHAKRLRICRVFMMLRTGIITFGFPTWVEMQGFVTTNLTQGLLEVFSVHCGVLLIRMRRHKVPWAHFRSYPWPRGTGLTSEKGHTHVSELLQSASLFHCTYVIAFARRQLPGLRHRVGLRGSRGLWLLFRVLPQLHLWRSILVEFPGAQVLDRKILMIERAMGLGKTPMQENHLSDAVWSVFFRLHLCVAFGERQEQLITNWWSNWQQNEECWLYHFRRSGQRQCLDSLWFSPWSVSGAQLWVVFPSQRLPEKPCLSLCWSCFGSPGKYKIRLPLWMKSLLKDLSFAADTTAVWRSNLRGQTTAAAQPLSCGWLNSIQPHVRVFLVSACPCRCCLWLWWASAFHLVCSRETGWWRGISARSWCSGSPQSGCFSSPWPWYIAPADCFKQEKQNKWHAWTNVVLLKLSLKTKDITRHVWCTCTEPSSTPCMGPHCSSFWQHNESNALGSDSDDLCPAAHREGELVDGVLQQDARVRPLVLRDADALLPVQQRIELRLQCELHFAAVLPVEDASYIGTSNTNACKVCQVCLVLCSEHAQIRYLSWEQIPLSGPWAEAGAVHISVEFGTVQIRDKKSLFSKDACCRNGGFSP